MPIAAEELRAMRLADKEIERDFQLTADDIDRAREMDRVALFERKDTAAQRAVARRKAYYEAHREKIAARKKVYRAAHREEEAAQQKAYRAAHREKIAAQQKAYRERKKKEREGLKNGAVDY